MREQKIRKSGGEEIGEGGFAGRFVDEGGFDLGDLFACGEGVHGEVAEVIGVADGDVEDEVLAAGDVVDGLDFGEGLGVVVEGLDGGAGVGGEANGDDGFEGDAEGVGVDAGVVAEEDAVVTEAADAFKAGGGG